MKKTVAHIAILSFIILLVGGLFVPTKFAFASTIGTFFNVTMEMVNTGIGWVGGWVLEISARILAISGILLNSAMNVTLNMSHLINETTSINATWRVIRDFSSIIFIFMLLYASISLIIGRDDYEIKKLIPKIVLVGLLINFSLFFTKVVVDFSNVAALGFYNAIAPEVDSSRRGFDKSTLGLGLHASDGGISNVFMQALGIETLYNPGAISKAKEDFTDKSIPALYLGSVIMLIAAGGFFAISLMLLVRIVVLMLLMAFSPLYFLSWVLPSMGSYAKRWRENLVGQAIFPVVYLALVYVALKIMSSFKFLNEIQKGGKSSFSEAFIAGDNVSIIFNYLIVIILLNVALGIAIKTMGEASTYSNFMVKKMKSFGMTAVSGGATWASRNTAGRLASKAANSEWLKDKAAGGGLVSTSALKGLRGVATGYDKKLKTQVESRTKFAKSLGYNQDTVLDEERYISDLHDRIADKNLVINNASGTYTAAQIQQAKDDKKQLEEMIKTRKKIIGTVKNERQLKYAEHQDPHKVDSRTGKATMSLFDRVIKGGYVARKEKVASAEIKVGVLEKEIEQLEKDVNEVKPDIKRLEDKSKTVVRDAAGNPVVDAAGNPITPLTAQEQTDLDKARTKKADLDNVIREKKLLISNLKIIE